MNSQYWYRNKKNGYNNTGQHVTLKSGFTVLQTRIALSKAWIGYKIAKRKGEPERLKNYASVIHKLQRELVEAGIMSEQSLAKFPNIDIDKV